MPTQSQKPTKPTKEDAGLLIQLFAIAQSERVARSFLWYYDFFGEVRDPKEIDYESFLKKNPRGSEGYFKWTAIASFFETVGVLVRNGVLSESLVFDRWPVEWYWRYLETLVKADVDQGLLCDTAYYADNFKWLGEQATKWRAAGKGYARWQSGRAAK
jgi:hypothetical protein